MNTERANAEPEMVQRLRVQLRALTAESVKAGAVKDVQLRIPASVMHGQTSTQVMVLIDTGAEVCLVKKDLFPAECFQRSARPVYLTAANSQIVQGGSNEALLTLTFNAKDRDNGREVQVQTPSLLYEAAIQQDMILSYAWLAERGFDVCPRRHGLQSTTENRMFWIPGTVKNQRALVGTNLLTIPIGLVTVKPPRALDLFSGLGSAARVFRDHGYEVVTLDSDPKYGADICVDILDWDPTVYEPGHFDVVMACPPCTEYSRAMTRRPRRLEDADAIVQKTLHVIEHLKPKKMGAREPVMGTA